MLLQCTSSIISTDSSFHALLENDHWATLMGASLKTRSKQLANSVKRESKVKQASMLISWLRQEQIINAQFGQLIAS